MHRLGLAMIVAAVVAALASPVQAIGCDGIALRNGCLFTATGSDTSEPDDGFAVTNSDGVPLWDFVRGKDLQDIGYPISQRWVEEPFTLQAFQKVILQWSPNDGRMNYYNTLDVLANAYPEVQLSNVPPHQVLDTAGLSFPEVVDAHLAILESNPQIKAAFLAEPEWLNLYGLPIRYEEREVDRNPQGLQLLRAQRVVFEVWNVPAPGTALGVVGRQNIPDKVKPLSNVIIPDTVKVPATATEIEGPLARLSAGRHVEDHHPNAAAALKTLPWIQDGITSDEEGVVVRQLDLVLRSPQVFWALVEAPMTTAIQKDFSTLSDLMHLSHIDKTTMLHIISMPFLNHISYADAMAVSNILSLARIDPVHLKTILSSEPLQDGITDSESIIVSLLYLHRQKPNDAAAINTLDWVQDGIDYYPSPDRPDQNAGKAGYEQNFILSLIRTSMTRPQIFQALIRTDWLQDDLTKREYSASVIVGTISGKFDESAAMQILQMPFLNTIEEHDVTILHILSLLPAGSKPESRSNDLKHFLSHPSLQDGIRDGHVTTVALLDLELRNPDAAASLRHLPWIIDEIQPSEQNTVLTLRRLALTSTQVFDALLEKSWMRDGITIEESTITTRVTNLATNSRYEALALRIVNVAFLRAIVKSDISAFDTLQQLAIEKPELFGNLAAQSWVIDGVNPEETAFLITLLRVAVASPAFYDELLKAHFTQSKAITLPLAGDVNIWVFQNTPFPAEEHLPDIIDVAAHRIEEFLRIPFPTNNIILLVVDPGETNASYGVDAAHYGSHMVLHRFLGEVQHIPHETAHYYFFSDFGRQWLHEGAAEFVEAYVNHQNGTEDLASHRAKLTIDVQQNCVDGESSSGEHKAQFLSS